MALSLQRYTRRGFTSGINQILKERNKKEREKFLPIAMKIGDRLPESLIIEILSWLPVKELLQYKTVCKSWYAIISSSDFISKHLKNYYDNHNDSWRGCILAEYYVNQEELQLFELLIDETPRVIADEVLYHIPMYSDHIYGPCDGLYYQYYFGSSHRALWNPAINELRSLPPIISKPNLPANATYCIYEVNGFGFDPVSRDYKVVVIKGYCSTNDEEINLPLSVVVYSLGTDSWKYCGDLSQEYDLENNKCYTFVNGCCYWLGSSSRDEEIAREVVISFDMATDVFQKIHLPNYEQPAAKSLGIYDESLALLCVNDNEKILNVWTFSEGTWTNKISSGPFPDVRNPVGHWKDNKLVLESEDGELLLYDNETQEIKNLEFNTVSTCQGVISYMEKRISNCEGVLAYMESLVSVKDSSTRVEKGEKV